MDTWNLEQMTCTKRTKHYKGDSLKLYIDWDKFLEVDDEY